MNKSDNIGWREQKRRETHRRVWERALTLFATNGYEATTLDAIAEASSISKRTFFHYFKSKEDILGAWQEGLPDVLHAAIIAEPEGLTPFEILRNVLLNMSAPFDGAQAVLINRIVSSSEHLRAGSLAKHVRLEETAVEALTERWPQPERYRALQVVVMAAIGVLRLAVDRYAEAGGQTPITDFIREAFADMATEIPHECELPHA